MQILMRILGIVALLGAAAVGALPLSAQDSEPGPCQVEHGAAKRIYVENCVSVALIIGTPLANPSVNYAAPLKNVASDLGLIAEALPHNFELIGGGVQIEPNRQEIIRLFVKLNDRLKNGDVDVVLIYMSGHGFRFRGENFFVPSGAPHPKPGGDPSNGYYRDNFIALSDVSKFLRGTQHNTLIVDACREEYRIASQTNDTVTALDFNASPTDPNVFFLASTTPGQYAYDAAPEGSAPSPFAGAFAELLKVENTPQYEGLVPMNNAIEARTKGEEAGPQRPWIAASPTSLVYWRGNGSAQIRPEAIAQETAIEKWRRTRNDQLWRVKDGPQIAYDALYHHKSATVIQSLAEAGVGEAAYVMAILYTEGIGGLAEDLTEATIWAEKAHELGSAHGTAMVGYLAQRNGDKQKAQQFYSLAAARGLVTAKAALGSNYLDLWGDSRITSLDDDKGLALLAETGAAGHLYSINALFERGLRSDDLALERAAIGWARNAASNDDSEIANWLCHMYNLDTFNLSGELENFPKDRFNTCKQAADGGFVFSQAMLSKLYLQGSGVELDRRAAREWAMRTKAHFDTPYTKRQDRTYKAIVNETLLPHAKAWLEYVLLATDDLD